MKKTDAVIASVVESPKSLPNCKHESLHDRVRKVWTSQAFYFSKLYEHCPKCCIWTDLQCPEPNVLNEFNCLSCCIKIETGMWNGVKQTLLSKDLPSLTFLSVCRSSSPSFPSRDWSERRPTVCCNGTKQKQKTNQSSISQDSTDSMLLLPTVETSAHWGFIGTKSAYTVLLHSWLKCGNLSIAEECSTVWI